MLKRKHVDGGFRRVPVSIVDVPPRIELLRALLPPGHQTGEAGAEDEEGGGFGDGGSIG
jgi:hypothetical protein